MSKRDMSKFFDNMLVAGDLLECFLDKFIEEYEKLSDEDKKVLYDLVCRFKPECCIGAGVIGMVKFYIENNCDEEDGD